MKGVECQYCAKPVIHGRYPDKLTCEACEYLAGLIRQADMGVLAKIIMRERSGDAKDLAIKILTEKPCYNCGA